MILFGCLLQVRFSYAGTVSAGFVEMSHAWSRGPACEVIFKFRQALLAVHGVDRVDLHPKGSKEQQNNRGNHYQDHNFAVHSEMMGAKTFIEFELTRYNHRDDIREGSLQYTVTACFKMPSHNLVAEQGERSTS